MDPHFYHAADITAAHILVVHSSLGKMGLDQCSPCETMLVSTSPGPHLLLMMESIYNHSVNATTIVHLESHVDSAAISAQLDFL